MAGNFVTKGIIKGACLNVFGEGGDHVRQTIPRERKDDEEKRKQILTFNLNIFLLEERRNGWRGFNTRRKGGERKRGGE